MRLGIFGGSFDPPHVGHLLAASDAFELLDLDRLIFVPAAIQPFKRDEVEASAAERFRMVELTVGDDERFAGDPVEIDRKGLSFTVETLDSLARRHPQARLILLIGEDLADEIATWRDAHRIAELADVVVLSRVAGKSDNEGGPRGMRLTRIATRRIDISSTEIRARVRAGKSIHGYVTEAVAGFIEATGLYRHRGTTC